MKKIILGLGLLPIYLSAYAVGSTDFINLDGTVIEQKQNTATDTTASKECSSLSEKFYKGFWEIEPSNNFEKSIYDETQNNQFVNQLILESLTGVKNTSNSGLIDGSALKNLYNFFNLCLPDSGSCPNKFQKFSEDINVLMDVKRYIASLEQCYANFPGVKSGLTTSFGQRNLTEFEKKINVACDVNDAINILTKIYNKGYVSYSPNLKKIGSAGRLKTLALFDMENVHELLTFKFAELQKQLFQKVNQDFFDKNPGQSASFIDSTSIKDEAELRNIFSAFTDSVSIKSSTLPVSLISRDLEDDNTSIMQNNELTNSYSAAKRKNVSNYRKIKKVEFKDAHDKVADSMRSFGILKQAAISNISQLVSERKGSSSTNSQLFEINKAINEGLNISEEKDKKIPPSEVLKQIRDSINLGNKIAYKRLITQEKMLVALTSTQIAALSDLANQINSSIDSINRIANDIDNGDDMTATIGQAPSITQVK